MAAAGVSDNPYSTAVLSGDIDQEDKRLRASSTDSIDNELDWLIQNETQTLSSKQEAEVQERANPPRSESRLEEERQNANDVKGESPTERAATPDASDDLSNFDDDKETDEYYAQASEELLVQQELQKLKDEGIIPQSDEPVFDYDIAERVKQLNEELANEDATPEKKNRVVNFSDKLVEFSPSPDFSGEDQESEKSETDKSDQTDPNDLEVEKLTLNDEQESQEDQKRLRFQSDNDFGEGGDISASESHSKSVSDLPNANELDRLGPEGERHYVNGAIGSENNGDLQAGISHNTQGAGDEIDGVESNEQNKPSPRVGDQEKLLIEKNGKFELVNVKDLSAEERVMMGLAPPNTKQENSNNSAAPSATTLKFQPSPPVQRERPSTATLHSGVRRQQLPPRRIQSAKTHREASSRYSPRQSSLFDWEARSSGYGMSAEQKSSMRRMYRMQLQQQKEQQEREEEEKKQAKEESEKAFQWWLNKKREEDKQKRKEEKEKKKKEHEEQDSNEHDPEEAYQAWLQNKKEQAKLERQMKKRMDEEKDRAFCVRDRTECDQAFKEWLRSKNSQLRQDKSMKRTTAAYSQKTARLSRKSRQLAKALQIAQAYRYTEYYGYRF